MNNDNKEELISIIDRLDQQCDYVISVINELTPLTRNIEHKLDRHDQKFKINDRCLAKMDKEIIQLKKLFRYITISFTLVVALSFSFVKYIHYNMAEFKNLINTRIEAIEYYNQIQSNPVPTIPNKNNNK